MATSNKPDKFSEELNKALENSEPLQEKKKIVSDNIKKPVFEENPFYKHSKSFTWTILALIVVVIIIIWALVQKPPVYKTVSVTSAGYTYSYLFDKNATLENDGAAPFYIGYNLTKTNKLQVLAIKSPIDKDCHAEFRYSVAYFKTSIQGESYTTCTDKNKYMLVTTFKYSGVWQEFQISSVNQKTPVDINSAQTIISSVKITN